LCGDTVEFSFHRSPLRVLRRIGHGDFSNKCYKQKRTKKKKEIKKKEITGHTKNMKKII